MKIRQVLKLLILLVFGSCHQEGRKTSVPTAWKTETLRFARLRVPVDFKHTVLQGVDSSPGTLANEAFTLSYDSGIELGALLADTCQFDRLWQVTQSKIEDTAFRRIYQVPIKNRAYLDTIDKKPAIIIVPQVTGQGTTSVSLMDCKTGFWFYLA